MCIRCRRLVAGERLAQSLAWNQGPEVVMALNRSAGMKFSLAEGELWWKAMAAKDRDNAIRVWKDRGDRKSTRLNSSH